MGQEPGGAGLSCGDSSDTGERGTGVATSRAVPASRPSALSWACAVSRSQFSFSLNGRARLVAAVSDSGGLKTDFQCACPFPCSCGAPPGLPGCVSHRARGRSRCESGRCVWAVRELPAGGHTVTAWTELPFRGGVPNTSQSDKSSNHHRAFGKMCHLSAYLKSHCPSGVGNAGK